MHLIFFPVVFELRGRLVSVPLSQGELSAGLAGLILNEVRNQIGSHPDVGSSVAAHLVVVGR